MTETETLEAISKEILGDLRIPTKDDYLREMHERDVRAVYGFMNDTTMPDHIKKHKIAKRSWLARTFIAQIRYESSTPRKLRHWYPGGDAECGFLDWGESLELTITEDAAKLEAHNMSAEDVGLRLKQLLDEKKVPSGFSVNKTVYRGYQRCPFDECRDNKQSFDHAHLDFQLVNTSTGEGIVGPGLIWHLIAQHSFFEGKMTKYRVDPVQLIKVLFAE